LFYHALHNHTISNLTNVTSHQFQQTVLYCSSCNNGEMISTQMHRYVCKPDKHLDVIMPTSH